MEALNESIRLNEVAEITLSYPPKLRPSQRPKVDSSRKVYEVFYRFWNQDSLEYVEQFQVMLLSAGNRVLGIFTISTARTDRTFVDAKVVFAAALKANVDCPQSQSSLRKSPVFRAGQKTRQTVSGDLKGIGSSCPGSHHPGPGRIFFLR